jgi:hypothetical protein
MVCNGFKKNAIFFFVTVKSLIYLSEEKKDIILLIYNNIQKITKLCLATIVCCMLVPTESVAQLVVKENTIFSIHTPVYSLEKSNAFYANVTGKAALHFKVKQQTLAVAKNAYLTNVSIDNASQFRIITKINIKGNLDILSGVLALEHPLLIGGKLAALNTATVQNAYLITFIQQHIEPAEGLFSFRSPTAFVANFSKDQKGVEQYNFIKKHSVSQYAAAFYQRYRAAPSSPPPENS